MPNSNTKFYMYPTLNTITDGLTYNTLENKDYIYIYFYVLFSLFPGNKLIQNSPDNSKYIYFDVSSYTYYLKYSTDDASLYVVEMLRLLKNNCPELFHREGYLKIPQAFISTTYTETPTNYLLKHTDIYSIADINNKLYLELMRYAKYTSSVDKDTTNLLGDNYALNQILEGTEYIHNELYKSNLLEFFNPNLARTTFGRLIDISYFIKAFNFDNKIEKIITKLSKRNLIINLIGFGGVNTNFLYWTSRIVEYYRFNKPLFKSITIYDKDTLEYSNIFRIPFLCNDFAIYNFTTSKFKNLVSNHYYYPERSNNKYKVDLALCPEVARLTDELKILTKNVDNKVINTFINKSISIGAPDYKTRQDFYNAHKHFLCPIHKDNKLFIWQNPCYKNELSLETYGKIDLQKFFMNMIRMTLVILQKLSTIQITKETKDTLIFQSDMDSFQMPIIDGIKYN